MNYRVLLYIAGAWCVVSFGISCCSHDWLWFSRSGSFLTFVSVILAARKVIRDAAGRVAAADEKIEAMRDKDASDWAFAFLAVGTLIWGYGDLLKLIFTRTS